MSLKFIEESGMTFGGFDESELFHAEKSLICESLRLPTVEFILRHQDEKILFVEAKSSSPKPGNHERFDEFIGEICDKFIHSLGLYFSLVINRLNDTNSEMPDCFKSADYSVAEIVLLLVINGHEIKWLPPIKNALVSKLKRHIKTWRLKVVVFNHEQALSYDLIQS